MQPDPPVRRHFDSALQHLDNIARPLVAEFGQTDNATLPDGVTVKLPEAVRDLAQAFRHLLDSSA